MKRILGVLFSAAFVVSCTSDDDANPDAAGKPDTGALDSGGKDSTVQDTGTGDTGTQDTGVQDTGIQETGIKDSSSSDSSIQDGGVKDAGFSLNGCTDNLFVDLSAGNQSARTKDWDLNQSFPYCFTIDANQSFVWQTTVNLTFANHPLEPAGGDQNNPITLTQSGTSVSFQFANKGNFGFECMFHPGIMRGVIRVK